MRDASGVCTMCPTDTYSDTMDATSCISCPEGTFTNPAETEIANDVSLCVGMKKHYFFIVLLHISGA